jgi:hypothetical protein
MSSGMRSQRSLMGGPQRKRPERRRKFDLLTVLAKGEYTCYWVFMYIKLYCFWWIIYIYMKESDINNIIHSVFCQGCFWQFWLTGCCRLASVRIHVGDESYVNNIDMFCDRLCIYMRICWQKCNIFGSWFVTCRGMGMTWLMFWQCDCDFSTMWCCVF